MPTLPPCEGHVKKCEMHGGLYRAKLAEVVPVDVIEESHEWLSNCAQDLQAVPMANMAAPDRMAADLAFLERIFIERNDRPHSADT